MVFFFQPSRLSLHPDMMEIMRGKACRRQSSWKLHVYQLRSPYIYIWLICVTCYYLKLLIVTALSSPIYLFYFLYFHWLDHLQQFGKEFWLIILAWQKKLLSATHIIYLEKHRHPRAKIHGRTLYSLSWGTDFPFLQHSLSPRDSTELKV